jgi:5-methylcytosine-specific restriction endonuclease McrA
MSALRRSRIQPRRATPRRRLAPHWTFEDWELATHALLHRCRSLCEKCGQALGTQLERHHRQRREVGGDRLANLMALHPHCHTWITEHPEAARASGWIVSANGPIGGVPDPAQVPVRLPDGYLWLLHDDGTKVPAP